MPVRIKVLIVDDSLMFRQALIQNLSQKPDLEIVGYAINAFDAQRKIPLLKPDVITLDVEMPGMNGIDFLKKLLPQHPVPVILVSSLNLSVFDALSAGAVDFVRKPDMQSNLSVTTFYNALHAKLIVASRSHVKLPLASAGKPASAPHPHIKLTRTTMLDTMIIALGASTGGTEATLEVLKQLPDDIPGMVITQHMPEGFTKMYAERLNRLCAMEVKEAQNGDLVQRGRVLIAPGSLQMRVVKKNGRYAVTCTPGEKVSGHCPSVDVLFQSVAETAGRNAIGIIMTGMGKDGADGLLKMRKAGAFTIGQDRESCVVYGMPMVANNIGAVCIQASCHNIPAALQNYLNKL